MKKIDFSKNNGLVPVIIQGFKSKEVFMLGFMNKDSFKKTVKTGFVYFWSRTREKLWLKGETSGNKLKVMNIKTDCDKDTLLIGVKILGNSVCHEGGKTCFKKII